MPILYIHAGMPKTGTTALQSFLHRNRALLAERVRLYYPKTGIPSNNNKSQRLFPVQKGIWDCLKKEVSDFPSCDVVLSEEAIWIRKFQDLLLPNFDVIRQAFPGYDIKIVVYVRRIDEFVKSFFNQRTKGGRITANSYADFFQQVYNGEDGTLFFSQPLSVAASIVGRDNLILRPYDRNILQDGDIVTNFFSLLNRKIPAGAAPGLNPNLSLPDESLPFLSRSLLPLPFDAPLRKEIVNLLRQAYSFPKGSGAGEERWAELKEEISKIDEYAPGYCGLFAERELSFSFPEVDVKEPHFLFLASLLYMLLARQGKQSNMTVPVNGESQLEAVLSSRSWRYTTFFRWVKQKMKLLFNIFRT